MFETGLVSISFRDLTPEAVIRAATSCKLGCIEWGSDVHAPYTDERRLQEIAAMQKEYGITCSSYGTYFRLGVTPLDELPGYIHAAQTLGTKILRLWAGDRSPQKWSDSERDFLFDQCRQAARIAEDAGVILCLECHRNTYTETKECALMLMQAVHSASFQMYWQPNQERTIEQNLEYLRLLKPYTHHIHVFQWKGTSRFSLQEGIEEWQTYLKEYSGNHTLLLEFMPDNRLESLPAEAGTLHRIVSSLQ